jgi:hypothetical protein
MSCYPGEHRLVKAHPRNVERDQWYRREEVDALLDILANTKLTDAVKGTRP